jgi:hypothetical protein
MTAFMQSDFSIPVSTTERSRGWNLSIPVLTTERSRGGNLSIPVLTTERSQGGNYDSLLSISREELDAFTTIHANFKPKKQLKIAYNDILVRKFDTIVSYNPQLVFDEILAISGRKIDNILSEMDSKIDDVERQFSEESPSETDRWTIHTRFLKISVSLHCYTEYDFGVENTATHRVVVSFTAHFQGFTESISPKGDRRSQSEIYKAKRRRVSFRDSYENDASRIYGKDSYNIDAFSTVNNIYSRIQQQFSEL